MKNKKPLLYRLVRYGRFIIYDSFELLLLVKDFNDPDPVIEEPPGVIDIRFGKEENLYDLPDLISGKKIRLFFRRLNAGFDMLCLYYNEKLAGYLWFTTDTYHESYINKTIPVTKEDIYLFDAWMLPELRGKHLYLFGYKFFKQYCTSLGRHRMITICRNDPSSASYRMHKKLGFVPLRIIRLCRILSFKSSNFLPFKGFF